MQVFKPSRLLLRVQCAWGQRLLGTSFTGTQVIELSHNLKHNIEGHWHKNLNSGKFDSEHTGEKFYVLSMFPYPSGSMHMGHVRVYTISDAMARFHRMCGKNVFQPMGWDAFGLPAENAAIERGIEPAKWTVQNIEHMKLQLESLGCSFDWKHEVSTCAPEYYKWTQKLFLMLHKEGLAYQNEAYVNWDPVDKTVLADEQVDSQGYSWRSGVKVEKKLLRQWFIRTTAFAKRLLDGLYDPILQDWRDIVNLQRHWIGECNGYAFQLLTSAANSVRVWTKTPEQLKDPYSFLVLKTTHHLAKSKKPDLLAVENPFAGVAMPVVFSDDVEFPDNCDVYLVAPSLSDKDKELQAHFGLPVLAEASKLQAMDMNKARQEVLEAAQRLKIGGHPVSSKLQDWLISRQRYWGTPIPIIHCSKCGAVPVPEEQLPVMLPDKNAPVHVNCICPTCGNGDARRETDTMDTFVDSSWYYLRYLDAQNSKDMFDPKLTHMYMPVDLYIGGKEHAVLHLYYARFMNHFLHSKELVPHPEPFRRLLVQGMVMGRSFKVKATGRYVKESECDVINCKRNVAILKETKEPVTMSWEKMSKSKLNGVDPLEMFHEYGIDTTRLIVLADVAPTSHRNWSFATFPGILNWQKRLWLTVEAFAKERNAEETGTVDTKSEKFLAEDAKLFDARNYYVKGATFNYLHTHQLSVAVSKMQGLTNSIRRAPKDVVRYGKQYERALACQLIMLAPMAPHFASELWAKFAEAPHRLNVDCKDLHWDRDVLEQRWPEVDLAYNCDLTIKINGLENSVIKIARQSLDKVTHNDALDIAFNTAAVTSSLVDKKIKNTVFVLYPGIEAVLNIFVDRAKQDKPTTPSSNEEVLHK